MLSYLLVVAILAYLTLLGLATAALFDPRIPRVALLISPTTGLGVLICSALTLSRAGIAVEGFALWIVLALGAAAVGVLVWRRPTIPWDVARMVALPLGAGLLLSGAPLLMYGFHWAGNMNGDMTLYVSSAMGFLHHGFFDIPSLQQLFSNAESGRNMWFWEVMPPNRYGADIFVATVGAIVHVLPLEVYMPCSVAMFGGLILGTAAMSEERSTRTRIVLASIIMAVAMPLMLYAVYQQILPQLIGQVAMVGFVALLQAGDLDTRSRVQRSVLMGVALVGLLLVYPESSPLLLMGAFLLLAVALVQYRGNLAARFKPMLPVFVTAALTVVVMLNVQIFTVMSSMTVLFKIGGSVSNAGLGTLNYYLVPSGIANLWGLVPFSNYPEPWLSFSIVVGFAALIAATYASIRMLRTGKFSTAMLLSLLAFFSYLFFRRSSYGLFKVAYIMQPFLVPLIVSAILRLAAITTPYVPRISQRAALAIFTACFVLATSYSTYVYLGASSDLLSKKTAQFTELYQASKDDLYGQLDRIENTDAAKKTPFITDASLQNLAEAEGIMLIGHPMLYASSDPFAGMFGAADEPDKYAASAGRGNSIRLAPIIGWPTNSRELALRTARERARVFKRRHIRIEKRQIEAWIPPAEASAFPSSQASLIETGPNLSILNRNHIGRFDVRAVPMNNVKNWLVLTNSELGAIPESQEQTALGAVEPDPFDPNNTLTTVGKTMLLEVLNASPEVRLKLALTATLNPTPNFALPSITLTGANTVTIPSLGVGMAQIITPPVRPLIVSGHRYIALRFGDRLFRYPTTRTSLMQLFGTDVEVDPRVFALHGRDISAVDGSSPSPARVSNYPADLLNPDLRYSGIYEDGWIGKRFEIHLTSGANSDILQIGLNVPPRSIPNQIIVRVDGRKVGHFSVTGGHYVNARFPGVSAGEHDIVIEAASQGLYMNGDNRPTWAQLTNFGFIPNT
ncbi:MAG: hypothetical protein M3N19_05235 [Candidatus Eremiobacteraeota bacterium]|nr:hypothetical protein [Candidatus Eremiobacteraeota bacterium]